MTASSHTQQTYARAPSQQCLAVCIWLLCALLYTGHTQQVSAAAKLSQQVVRGLVRDLEQKQTNTTKILAQLHKLGPHASAAAPALVRLYHKQKSTQIRRAIVQTLGSLGPGAAPSSLPLFLSLLKQAPTAIQHSTIVALAHLGDKGQAARPYLQTWLQHKGHPLRLCSLQTIGKLGAASPSLRRLLLRLTEHPHASFRGHALRALVLLKDKHRLVQRAMRRALHDPHLGVTLHASAGLLHMTKPPKRPLLHALKRSLHSTRYAIRRVALRLSAQLTTHTTQALTLLIQGLSDPHPQLRQHAASLLGKLGNRARRAETALLHSLKDPDVRVRLHSSFALATFRPRSRAIQRALQQMTKDPSASVRYIAKRALRKP